MGQHAEICRYVCTFATRSRFHVNCVVVFPAAALSAFLLVILLTMELRPKAMPPKSDSKQPEAEGLERMDWVT